MVTRHTCLFITIGLATTLLAGCAWVVHPAGEAEQRALHDSVGAEHGYIGDGQLPDLTRQAQLRDVLCYADHCNGELRSSWHEWRAAIERVPQAGALEDPMFMFGYDFGFDPFNRADSGGGESMGGSKGGNGGGGGMGKSKNSGTGGGGTGSGMSSETDKWTVDRIMLGYVQNIRHPGKRATRAERALYEAQSAAERFRRTRFDVRNRTIAAYAELFYNQQVLELENQNLRLLTQLFEIASHQFHAGLLQQVDVTRLDIEIIRAKSQVRAAEIERDRRTAELNALLDRKPRDKFGALALGQVRLRTESADKLLQIAACNNPELAQTQRDIQARGADVVLADLENLPDFQINLPQVMTMSQQVMLGVTLPLNRERIDAGIREAEANRDAALARLHNQQSSALARLMVGITMLRDAQRILTDFGESIIGRSNEVLTLQQQYYGAGTGDIGAVLDTQRTLIELQRLVQRARVDRVRAVGEIESVAGCELMRLTRESTSKGKATSTQETSRVVSIMQPQMLPTASYETGPTTTETIPQLSPGVTPLDSMTPLPNFQPFSTETTSTQTQPAPAVPEPNTLPPLPNIQPLGGETTGSQSQNKKDKRVGQVGNLSTRGDPDQDSVPPPPGFCRAPQNDSREKPQRLDQ